MPLALPFSLVQHQAEHVKAKLREFKAHGAELVLGLMPQDMAPGSPEYRDRPPDGNVLLARFLVDEACVGNLSARSRRRPVDLGLREGLELGEPELARQCIDARVLEEADAFIVGRRYRRIMFHCFSSVVRPSREVLAVVKIFEHGAHRFEVFVQQLYASGLYNPLDGQ